jgi:hypothetical protein
MARKKDNKSHETNRDYELWSGVEYIKFPHKGTKQRGKEITVLAENQSML